MNVVTMKLPEIINKRSLLILCGAISAFASGIRVVFWISRETNIDVMTTNEIAKTSTSSMRIKSDADIAQGTKITLEHKNFSFPMSVVQPNETTPLLASSPTTIINGPPGRNGNSTMEKLQPKNLESENFTTKATPPADTQLQAIPPPTPSSVATQSSATSEPTSPPTSATMTTADISTEAGSSGVEAAGGSDSNQLTSSKNSSKNETTGPTKIPQHVLKPDHCVIHVHGFHHSGTGFLRQQIYEGILGGKDFASQHWHTGKPEDEGQHLQNVYPKMSNRMYHPNVCFDAQNGTMPGGILYYCPKIVETIPPKGESKQRLFNAWSKHWNMKKRYLIQKTPSFDVVLLERMKLNPTFHAIMIRHPFMWHTDNGSGRLKDNYAPKNHVDLIHPFMWLDVWANIFDALVKGEVESFVIVQYEALTNPIYQQEIRNEISSLIDDSCGNITNKHITDQPKKLHQERRRRERKLELHKGGVSKFQTIKSQYKQLWADCTKHPRCHNLMEDLEPIMKELLGYSWNMTEFYSLRHATHHALTEGIDQNKTTKDRKGEGNRQNYHAAGVIFSHQNLPSKELVDKMMALAKKYVLPV